MLNLLVRHQPRERDQVNCGLALQRRHVRGQRIHTVFDDARPLMPRSSRSCFEARETVT